MLKDDLLNEPKIQAAITQYDGAGVPFTDAILKNAIDKVTGGISNPVVQGITNQVANALLDILEDELAKKLAKPATTKAGRIIRKLFGWTGLIK